jgi:hypothetical protein
MERNGDRIWGRIGAQPAAWSGRHSLPQNTAAKDLSSLGGDALNTLCSALRTPSHACSHFQVSKNSQDSNNPWKVTTTFNDSGSGIVAAK